MIAIKLITYSICAYALAEMMVFARGPFGLFNLIRYGASKISDGLAELFGCMLCLPMWIGMAFSVLNIFVIPSMSFVPSMVVYGLPLSKGAIVFNVIADGLFTAGVSWLLYQIESFVETFQQKGQEDEGDER